MSFLGTTTEMHKNFIWKFLLENTINGNHVSCFGGNDGKVAVTAVGGETPYTYSWNTTPFKQPIQLLT